jgi:hypothetical protein
MKRINFLLISFMLSLPFVQAHLNAQAISPNFIVHHDATHGKETVQRVIDQLENDYREFRHLFNLPGSGQTPVVLHSTMRSYLEKSMASRREFGTIRNDVLHLAPLSYIRGHTVLSAVLTQQAVRLVLRSRYANGCPRWLYEGAAAYFAGFHRYHTGKVTIHVHRPSDLDELFTDPGYINAYDDILYLAALSFGSVYQRYGETKTVTLLRLFNGVYEYEDAVPYSLGVTLERFERQWRNDVRTFVETDRESR